MRLEDAFNGLGYIVFKRTYARKVGGRTETFEESIDRVLDGCDNQLGVSWDVGERDLARKLLLGLKGSVAGRFLWQLGTSTIDQLGLSSLQNCAATVVDDPVRPFTWAMDMLMLGSGVGYNIQLKNVYKLPKVKHINVTAEQSKDADFIVPDSREGWVLLLEKLLKAHFEDGKDFSYSTILIRGYGEPIKGFGGEASGPAILIKGIDKINKVLNARAGKELRPVDALDVMNIIGEIVVAGNVRRSAQIAIGDSIDRQYMNAKRWDLFDIPNHRAFSNNSVYVSDIDDLSEDFWEGYKGNGEPYGLINIGLCKTTGRLGELRFDNAEVFNPCAEQPLAPYETCCLAEIFLPNVESKEEMWDITRILYKINKHSLNLHSHHPETEKIVHENQRMGIGITGWMMATEEQIGWLNDIYLNLRIFDKHYSAKHGFNESIRLTTVKPSGTLSLLGGVSPGIHPAYSRYMIRRVRVSATNPLLSALKAAGYNTYPVQGFDGTPDRTTSIVEFPVEFPEGTKVAADMSAIDQMEWIKKAQTIWSDNAVSCTVYYRKEELPEMREWLRKNYTNGIKSISFLLHSDHGFAQAPLEEIDKQKYDMMVAQLRPIRDVDGMTEDDTESAECASGACPIK